MLLARCTLEIDLTKIKANYRTLCNICTNSSVQLNSENLRQDEFKEEPAQRTKVREHRRMPKNSLVSSFLNDAVVGAAVKANSYGLGANQISKALEEEGCQFFFVASIEEGVNLRKILNSDSNILVLNGVFQNQISEFVEHNLIPVLNNLKQIEVWQQFAKTQSRLLPCFLHFNTGMNRLGLTDIEIKQIINNPGLLAGLQIQYIISHLSASEESNNPYNLQQLTKFKDYLQYFPNVKASLANSGGIFLDKNYHFDLVRPGAALYGLNPLGKTNPNPMQNVITLTAPIIHLQKLTVGTHIGYNTSFTVERDSIIATLPLGYADGYSRNFSNCGKVFINGHIAPVVGRVSMDLVNIDVTDLPPSQIFLGQEVEIIGNYYTPDKISDIINTIGYEILTSLGNRYKRVYKK